MVMLFVVVATFAPDEILIYNIIRGRKHMGSMRVFDV